VRLASYEVTIAAPIEVVWTHLTTAEGLIRWVGPAATADPAPGGVLRWTHPDGARVVGRFVELVPHRRLVFTYPLHGSAAKRRAIPRSRSSHDTVDAVVRPWRRDFSNASHALPLIVVAGQA
jgi:uncharacterized protein YndB with AHSA1/START domain